MSLFMEKDEHEHREKVGTFSIFQQSNFQGKEQCHGLFDRKFVQLKNLILDILR